MSEMIIIECDYEDGGCLERFEGFTLLSSKGSRNDILKQAGWLVRDDEHYCPLHKEQVLREVEGE